MAIAVHHRLSTTIFLAVIGSLGLFALAVFVTWRVQVEGDAAALDRVLSGQIVEELAPLVPQDPDAARAVLQRWHEAAPVDFMITGPRGGTWLRVGRTPRGPQGARHQRGPMPRHPPAVPPAAPPAAPHAGDDAGQEGVPDDAPPGGGPRLRMASFELGSGHRLLILPDRARLRTPAPGVPLLLALLLMAVAAVAWPLSRRITRRLEALQGGVERFGAGQFEVRVQESGRDEVGRLARRFNETAGRIAALMQSQRQLLQAREDTLRGQRRLLANVSHELRSPLARIRMASDLLSEGSGLQPADRLRWHAEIGNSIAEIDAMVEEILESSRLQHGALRFEQVDLTGLAAEEAARTGAVVCADGPALCAGDARLLRRMLRNLLENAARYHAAGAGAAQGPAGIAEPVQVCIDDAASHGRAGDAAPVHLPAWRIRILDRGPGVPASERERIFEPFHRLEGHRESEGNVGLGLALARQIAVSHGGLIECRGREGAGACFEVILPAGAH